MAYDGRRLLESGPLSAVFLRRSRPLWVGISVFGFWGVLNPAPVELAGADPSTANAPWREGRLCSVDPWVRCRYIIVN